MTTTGRSRASRAITAAVFLSLLTAAALAGPVAALGISTSATLTVQATPYAFVPTTFKVDVGVGGITTPAPCGTVYVYETTTGSDVLTATIPYDSCAYGGEVTQTRIDGYDLGTHTFKAVFDTTSPAYEDSESAPVDYVVGVSDSTVGLSGPTAAETHHAVLFEAGIGNSTDAYMRAGTVTFRRSGSATALCVLPADHGNFYDCNVASLPVGTWDITAEYSGNTWVTGSTSSVLTISVGPDTVHATNVGVSVATFYPIKDGYYDSVAIRGTRGEPIGVTIRIYKPSGALLATKVLASGTGAYSWSWNGRTSSGALLPEGKYKIVQTLKDSAGTTQAWTSYVNLSHKKLYVHTATISKLGSQLSAKGTYNLGKVTVSTTGGYTKLYVPGFWTSWAGAGWQLTLPSATVYKSFYVRIYGKHSSVGGTATLGAQNFTACAYSSTWDESCFGATKVLDPSVSLIYSRTSNLSSAFRYGRTVRLMVSSYGATTYIYKAQVVVTYGILKY